MVQIPIQYLTSKDDSLDLLKSTIPHIIKYMGSKKPIIDFVTSAIEDLNTENLLVCDLFAGSCSISAALRRKFDFISNDIQTYSEVLAKTYFSDLSSFSFSEVIEKVSDITNEHVKWFKTNFKGLFFDYYKIDEVDEYQRIESLQRELLTGENFTIEYHLFTKYYSGTYWSFEQCVWIDALRKAAKEFENTEIYYSILSSIMYAMSYTTQSTGHFAQYRDGNTDEAVENIILYRQKNIYSYFSKKLKELCSTLGNSLKNLTTTTLNFEECLKTIPKGSVIYADPPYAPVHYSRFYHALETLVKYDYPKVVHKGRYRNDRHQSPFSQKGNALEAFKAMFQGIIAKQSQMILSYSNNGVIEIDKIIDLVKKEFGKDYLINFKIYNHIHSTMGRFEDARREVLEYLIIAKHK